jgi:hypothetical protein
MRRWRHTPTTKAEQPTVTWARTDAEDSATLPALPLLLFLSDLKAGLLNEGVVDDS